MTAFLGYFANSFGQGKLERSVSWITGIEKFLYYFLGYFMQMYWVFHFLFRNYQFSIPLYHLHISDFGPNNKTCCMFSVPGTKSLIRRKSMFTRHMVHISPKQIYILDIFSTFKLIFLNCIRRAT